MLANNQQSTLPLVHPKDVYLSPLGYILYTKAVRASLRTDTLIKFANDSVIVILLKDGEVKNI